MNKTKRELIFDVISKSKEICVSDIVNKTGLEQSLVSHHLRTLKDLKLVTCRVDYKNRYYRLLVQT